MTRVKIAHNIAFDLPRLQRAGVKIEPPVWDTMLAANLLQPDLYKGLNPVASLYLDRQRWKHLDESDPALYNALDAQVTLELYEVLHSALTATGQLKLFEGTIMPAVLVLIRMSQRGLKMDATKRAEWREGLVLKEAELRRRWDEREPGVNPFSPKQVAGLVYRKWGLPMQPNKYGGVSTDEASLRELMRLLEQTRADEQRTRLGLLLDLREVSKMRSTYAETPLGTDGCVHPSYLPGAKDDDLFGKGLAGTGRLTAKEPNIQNQPPEARKLYVPHGPDNVLIEADWSQIELRCAAALSGDGALMEALKGDVFAEIGQRLGTDRTRTKNVVYGTLFGAGARKLATLLRARGIDTNERECRELQGRLAQAYPTLWRWREEIVTRVSKDYMLRNPFGRCRYFYGGAKDAPAAIDFLPQSTAADIMWATLVPLEAALAKVEGVPLTVVHDSFLCEVPKGRLIEAIDLVRGVMERPFDIVAKGFRVPIKVKVGSSWGTMEEVNAR